MGGLDEIVTRTHGPLKLAFHNEGEAVQKTAQSENVSYLLPQNPMSSDRGELSCELSQRMGGLGCGLQGVGPCLNVDFNFMTHFKLMRHATFSVGYPHSTGKLDWATGVSCGSTTRG